jgi:diguanylate cyclase (GGDEF)-like protein
VLRVLNRSFAAQAEWLIGAVTLLLVLFLSFVDHVTGYEISFSIFYLLPISIAVWYGSRPMGYAISAASAVAWAVVEHTSALAYSQGWILYWNSGVRLAFFLVVGWLLAELKGNLRRHQHLASTDNLTGLLNRTGFIERAGPIMAAATRHGHPTTIGFADLNGFKQVNDTLGHASGDAVLELIGSLLTRTRRSSDIAARYGGDEFVVLLPHTGLEGARRFFDKFRRAAEGEIRDGGWTGLSVSIGAIVFERGPPDLIESLRIADHLMYRAKGAGSDGAGRIIIESATSLRNDLK